MKASHYVYSCIQQLITKFKLESMPQDRKNHVNKIVKHQSLTVNVHHIKMICYIPATRSNKCQGGK